MTHSAELVFKPHRDYAGAKLGMWLFLFTELLLFGGLFLLYSAYRAKYASDFHDAAMELNTLIGTINTMILLTSSLTMALSILSLHRKDRNLSLIFLALTILFGLLFLLNKYFEWKAKIAHGIYPNSEHLQLFNHGEILYYGLYFTMTGLHGLHVLIGMVVLSVMFLKIARRPVRLFDFLPAQMEQLNGARIILQNEKGEAIWEGARIDDSIGEMRIALIQKPSRKAIDHANIVKLENSGLYWHLVDIIWIFLFPLFYLIT